MKSDFTKSISGYSLTNLFAKCQQNMTFKNNQIQFQEMQIYIVARWNRFGHTYFHGQL